MDAARMLNLTADGVRFLAREGRLVSERTVAGQWLFRAGDVQRLIERRARKRLLRVATARPMEPGEPRQLALFGGARIRLVSLRRHESTSLRDPEVEHARSLNEMCGS
jgi:hypothetical protein